MPMRTSYSCTASVSRRSPGTNVVVVDAHLEVGAAAPATRHIHVARLDPAHAPLSLPAKPGDLLVRHPPFPVSHVVVHRGEDETVCGFHRPHPTGLEQLLKPVRCHHRSFAVRRSIWPALLARCVP